MQQLRVTPIPIDFSREVTKKRRLSISSFLKMSVPSEEPASLEALQEASEKQRQEVDLLVRQFKDSDFVSRSKRKRIKAARIFLNKENYEPPRDVWTELPEEQPCGFG
jgi:hypothetical protein